MPDIIGRNERLTVVRQTDPEFAGISEIGWKQAKMPAISATLPAVSPARASPGSMSKKVTYPLFMRQVPPPPVPAFKSASKMAVTTGHLFKPLKRNKDYKMPVKRAPPRAHPSVDVSAN
jgi:hypothetical protein